KKRLSSVQVSTESEGDQKEALASSVHDNRTSSQPHSAANSSETSPANTVKSKEKTLSEEKVFYN
ncbi:hypothetical protein O3G_MSEX000843, partial [Manduca sexta]